MIIASCLALAKPLVYGKIYSMAHDFDYSSDFSRIDLVELKQLPINRNEVIRVFNNPLSQLKACKGFLYLPGFSERKKIIQIAFNISKNQDLRAKEAKTCVSASIR